MRAIVTGAAGFAGSYLVEHLLGHGYEVYGVDRSGPGDRALQGVLTRAHFKLCDLRYRQEIDAILSEVRPDAILHLAGDAVTYHSIQHPYQTFEANVLTTINLLESVKGLGLRARVLLVTSAEVYGEVSLQELPLREGAPFRPVHPYAISKVAVHHLGQLYFRQGIQVIEARAFNHIGPRQRPGFVVPDFAIRIARILCGREQINCIYTGNLHPEKDFTDVRDVVQAYRMIIEGGRAGEVYHVCSERFASIREILDMLLAHAGIQVEVRVDGAKVRPTSCPRVLGSSEKIRSELGWAPAISLKQSLKDTLDYWLERVRDGV
jgi:GDP-4-dehydro-6-deoxy-D-mannose reductase